MTADRLLRVLGIADVASGALALAAASWLAGELDVSTTAVRVAGAILVLLGIETFAMAAKPLMAKATVAVEAVAALVALDVLLLADPTTTGAVLLVATALWCAAVAIETALLLRTRDLAPVS